METLLLNMVDHLAEPAYAFTGSFRSPSILVTTKWEVPDVIVRLANSCPAATGV